MKHLKTYNSFLHVKTITWNKPISTNKKIGLINGVLFLGSVDLFLVLK